MSFLNGDENNSHEDRLEINGHTPQLNRILSSDSDSESDSPSTTRAPVRPLSPFYTFENRLIDFLDGFSALTDEQKREIKEDIIEVIVMRIFRHQHKEGYDEAMQAIAQLPSY
jgi:hypothetical protein